MLSCEVLSSSSGTGSASFQKTPRFLYLGFILLLSLFSLQCGLFWAISSFPVIECVHTSSKQEESCLSSKESFACLANEILRPLKRRASPGRSLRGPTYEEEPKARKMPSLLNRRNDLALMCRIVNGRKTRLLKFSRLPGFTGPLPERQETS